MRFDWTLRTSLSWHAAAGAGNPLGACGLTRRQARKEPPFHEMAAIRRRQSDIQGNRISKTGQQPAEKPVIPSRPLELSAQRSFRSLLLKNVHRHMA